MSYIGWATNVNKIILDSTNITVGNGAIVSDTLESGGQKKSRLISANPPDKYQVTMSFNCDDKDVDHDGNYVGDGLTEYERFMAWFKYRHCYGANPFQFPAILINSNQNRTASTEETEHIIHRIENGDTTAKLPDLEYYIITSSVEGNKEGHDQKVTMTWETYATGAYTIPDDEASVKSIVAENGYVDVVLTSTPREEPTTTTWNLLIAAPGSQFTQETVLFCVFDGDVTVRLYFEKKTSPIGIYVVKIDDKTSSFEVTL